MADTKRGAVWAAVSTKHNGVMLSIDDLREQLAAQGLHIVTTAEKAVLDSNSDLDQEWLRKCEFSREMWLVNFARAELARREQKK